VTTSAELQELYRQEQVSFEFLARHKDDFSNCEANVGLIKAFFQEHQLEWTLENLERAFSRLKPKLAPVPGAVTTQPSAPETPPPPPPIPVSPVVQAAAEPSGLTMKEINSWNGPTMRQKMANPVARKQIDVCLAGEAERLRQRQQTENQ
jgi:hypothetical protein